MREAGCGARAQTSSDVASSYASALLELASATGSLEAIHADMDALEGVCNDELMTFLMNPLMEQKKKEDILKKVSTEGQFSQATSNFLQLLVSKRRIAFLKEIIEEFDSLYCEATDTQVRPLTPDRLQLTPWQAPGFALPTVA
jgi:F-type H+-transporting ATPase subunit delta